MSELVVERLADEVELAFVEDGRLVDFRHVDAESVTGVLFAARVTALERPLDGAFLDTGEPVAGFILGREARAGSDRPATKKASIERILQVGQKLVVQGTREARGDKGARFTTSICLEGRFLALLPHATENHLSPRLKGRTRSEMEARAARLWPQGGILCRRLAAFVSDELLEAEATALRTCWQGLDARRRVAPGRLKPFVAMPEAAIWQALDHPITAIAVSDEMLAAMLRRLLGALPEAVRPVLSVLDAGQSAFDTTGVADEIERARQSVLELDGGGRLIIEQTAACVAIDVDGGGRAALDVDLEAAREIGLQARLRNLAGTIVVDFVDLPTRPQRQRLEEALRRAFKGDPLPVQLFPMSPLGIVQISRAHRGASPLAAHLRPCPTCGGNGSISR